MSDLSLRSKDLVVGPHPGFRLEVGALEVPAGARLAIIGPSGSGKTTLLHTLAGIHPVADGALEVLGVRLDGLPAARRRAFRRARLGLVFQTFALLEHLRAEKNLTLPLDLGVSRERAARARERFPKLVARLGLEGLLQRKPARLSHGERQRVAIGRALLLGPDLVLADEPTGNLDPKTKDGILDLLVETCEEFAATLVMVTHDHGLLDRFETVLDLGRPLVGPGPEAER
jgi:putative ABC transport system ATP-binding protein